MKRIRALVVDDSLTVRKRIVEVLSAREDFEVVAEAEDGKQAIELCQSLRPDVVTLDMMMPGLSGLSATEYIMAYCPTPILIVSSSTNRGELFKTFEALAAGALDVLEKPLGAEADGAWENKLVETLRLISRIKVITHPRARLGRAGQGPALQLAPQPVLPVAGYAEPRLLAIGASTGGPGAVRELLRGLPADFPLPIVVVIHLSRVFGSALAEWLDGESPLRVAFAADGEALPSPGQGRVFLAPSDSHLVLRHGRLRLDFGPERHSCKPSVDVLFESLAIEMGPQVAACLLTGMGRDGAAGLLAIRQAGGMTIAQDEASSVVYGMPREAALLGAAGRILPLDQIAPALMRLAPGAKLPRPG
jgi:two-component system chemotaxis response regulator CheB